MMRYIPLARALLLGVALQFSSAVSFAQTKPRVQVPTEERSQARGIVRQLLKEGKIMRSADAKRGMQGFGRSVFQGTAIEQFPVVVIGVLEKVMGGGDLVLIKILGGTVVKRNSGVIAGMSGSPVYINGKMLGAISIGFGFPKEPICGVTPITQMIETSLPDPERKKVVAPSGQTKPVTAALDDELYRPKAPLRVAGRNVTRVVVSRAHSRLALTGSPGAATMTMRPATMLLQMAGMSAASLPRWRKLFEPYGIEPVLGTGGSFPAQVFGPSSKKLGVQPAFVPGGAIGVQLVSGDMDMTGVGTITFRWGQRILAFGHPMFGKGALSLPMSSAFIHDIFPSYMQSFKLASPVKVVGALQQDTQFAIGGTIGMKADTVPMRVALHDPERQIAKTYRVQLMKDPLFTPMLMEGIAMESMITSLGMDSDKMVRMRLKIGLQGQAPIIRRNYVYANGMVIMAALGDMVEALMITQMNSFQKGNITSVDLDVAVEPVRKTARIRKIFADRNKVKAGETFRVNVVMEPTGKADQPITRTFEFTVPEDAPTGTVRVAAGSGADYWMLGTRVGAAPPTSNNLKELLAAYEKIGAANELLVQASTPSTFLMIDRKKVSNPPPSWAKLVPPRASSAIGSYNEIQLRSATSEFALSGVQSLSIPVESLKHSDKEKPDTASADSSSSTKSGDSAESTSSGAESMTGESMPSFNPSETDIGDEFGEDSFGSVEQEAAWQQPSPPTPLPILGEGSLSRTRPHLRTEGTKFGISLPSPNFGRGVGGEGYQDGWTPERSLILAQAQQWLRTGAWQPSPRPRALQTEPARQLPPAAITPAPAITVAPSEKPAPGAEAGATPTPSPTPGEGDTNVARAPLKWVQSTATDFNRGTFDGTLVTGEGTIQLAPASKLLATTAEPVAWSIAGDAQGNTYLGTGHEARIFRIDAVGNVKTLYDGPEVAVTALATDAAGNLYAGVSPGGRIYRFNPAGERTTIFHTGQEFVWALEWDDKGRLLIATGGQSGALYRLSEPATRPAADVNSARRAESTPLASVPQKHIRALAVRGADIFAGTGADAVLYRIDAESGTAKALFQATETASRNSMGGMPPGFGRGEEMEGSLMGMISSMGMFGPSGFGGSAMMLLANSEGTGMSRSPAGTGRSTGNEILALATAPEGVYFGTSSSGAVYRWNAENGVTTVFSAPQQSVYALRRAADGKVYAATGDKGFVYQIRPAPGTGEATVARLLEPTQLQALSLALSPGGDLLVGMGNNAAAYKVALAGAPNGTYLSNVFDATNIVRWGSLRLTGSGAAVETRSGNTLEPDASWSAWQPATRNTYGELRVDSPPARYLQYRARLSGDGAATSGPSLSRLELIFRPKNQAPTVKFAMPTGGDYLKGKKKLNWSGQDPDKDALRYRLWLSGDDGKTWTPVELKEPGTASFEVDTTKFADGVYRAKLEASDAARNPADPRRAETTSEPFVIDNTAPLINTHEIRRTAEGGWQLRAAATDNLSPIAGAEWRIFTEKKPEAKADAKSDAKTSTEVKKEDTKKEDVKKDEAKKEDPKKSAAGAKPTDESKTGSDKDSTKSDEKTDKDEKTEKDEKKQEDWQAVAASDDIFDSRSEELVATLDATSLPTPLKPGTKIELRVRDAAGNSVTLNLTLP